MSGNISLIYGEAETGKTTLASQCVVNCAKQGSKILFIDCDGTFSAKRLSQIASERFDEIAESVILMRPENFQQQAMIINKLGDYITGNFGLVVIDTINSLYRAQIAESSKTFSLNRELNKQLATLAQLARTKKIVILVLSQVRTAFREEHAGIEPVATRVLKFWGDTIINLMPTETPRLIKAILEKNSPQAQPIICYLSISASGICERSPR